MTARSVFVLLLLALVCAPLRADPEYKRMGPDIFDRSAKGEELIDKALELAGREHKRIFLLLGANWCPWCRRLHAAFTENPTVRAAIQQGFVLVYIDVNTRNDKKRNASINERYGNPLQNGLPVMVILDQDGKQLATQETASLAAPTDEEEAKRVMAVLTKWTPPAAPKRSN